MASAAILRETRRGSGGGWAVISKDSSEMETFSAWGAWTTDLASAHRSSLGCWCAVARLNDLYAREVKDSTWLWPSPAHASARERK